MSTVASRHKTASAPRRGGFWRNPALLSWLFVLLTVALANAIFLTGLRSSSPMTYYSGLASPSPGSLLGGWTIDPNVGWTVESLGRAAAHQWAEGDVPLWNSYEGLGQPLAGEMQSAALFQPFIMLQLLPNGVFVMHVVLEIFAGLATLAFLRRFGLGWVASTVGGCLFAVNGAFAVMTNAPFNPIAFLPLGLLGVEMIRASLQRSPDAHAPRRGGRRPWVGVAVLALAIAWMLFAGFPETAFLEALFIGCWALVRLGQARGHRLAFAGWTAAGMALGLALAAPVLVAFLDFMSWGSTSYHEAVANDISYPRRQIMSLALPFAVGALNNAVLRLQAGYLTLPALFMALVGLTGTKRRGIRLLLAGTMIVLIGNMFRFEPIKLLLNHTPGIKAILVYKYGISILEFAVVIAVALGVDDLARCRVGRRRTLVCASLTLAYAAVTLAVLVSRGYVVSPRWTTAVMLALAAVCAVLLVLLLRARTHHEKAPVSADTAGTSDGAMPENASSPEVTPAGATMVGAAPAAHAGATATSSPARSRSLAAPFAGALIVLTAAAHFALPQAGASRAVAIDMKPVHYLQQYLGTSRFYTLGPIQPDYGSYWKLGQLNVNDLPVPKKYGEFVLDELRPAHTGLNAKQMQDTFKDYQLIPFNPPAAVQRKLLVGYGEKQQAFREAGVRYLVTRPDVVSPAMATKLGLAKVLDSPKSDIFEDASAQPYYTSDGACRVRSGSRTDLTLTCSRPATLTRRELDAPGWSATVATAGATGSTKAVAVVDGRLYQHIEVPQGTSHVAFEYRPRYFGLAVGVSIAAALVLLVGGASMLVRRRRQDRHDTDVAVPTAASTTSSGSAGIATAADHGTTTTEGSVRA